MQTLGHVVQLGEVQRRDVEGFVETGGRQLGSIRAKGHIAHGALVSRDGLDQLAFGRVVDSDSGVVAGDRELLAVVAIGN